MFQLQFVIGLFIGFNFDIIHKVLNSPINAENDLDHDYYGAGACSLFDDPDRSMNEDKAYSEDESDNEELGPYFQGDILLPSHRMFRKNNREFRYIPTLWPNGVIPVLINSNFTQPQIKMIRSAIKAMTSQTCLLFPKRTIEKDYIYITDNATGCFSFPGCIGGEQIVNLHKPNCFNKLGRVQHEILHAVGFLHEQSRNDRDNYVEIKWENVEEGREKDFAKSVVEIQPSVDLTYDYSSIMHYAGFNFAIDRKKPTIVVLFNTTESSKIGQREGISPLDLKKINAKYQCDTKTQNQNDGLEFISFQFKSGNISLDLKYNADDINNE